MTDDSAAPDSLNVPTEAGHRAFHPDSLATRFLRYRDAAGADDGPSCRSPLRYRAFPVSETEFVVLLGTMLHSRTPPRIGEIIRVSKENRHRLEEELLDLAEKINGRTSLWEIFQLEQSVLPFACVFCAEGACGLGRARPLACTGLETPADFLFLKHGDAVIFRRPLPLFWWFSIVFRDEEALDGIADTPFYRGITEMSAQEYIKMLAEYSPK